MTAARQATYDLERLRVELPAPRLPHRPPEGWSPGAPGWNVVELTAGRRDVRLSGRQDVELRLPEDAPLTLADKIDVRISPGTGTECRVVLVGGALQGECLRIAPQGNAREVYVEGVDLNADARGGDGVIVDMRHPEGRLKLQNIRCGPVQGTRDGHHADVLQTWGGPAYLHVAHLEGLTTYQGMFLNPTQYGSVVPRVADLRDVVLRGVGPDSAYLAWLSGTHPELVWRIERLYLAAENGVTLVRGAPFGAAREHPDGWTPNVLLGNPGVGYTSPGYQGA